MAASAIRRRSKVPRDPGEAESPNGFIEVREARGKTTLVLTGRWTVENTGAIEAALEATLGRRARGTPDIDAESIERLDTSGALLLKRLLPEGELPRRLTREQRGLLEFLPPFTEYKGRRRPRHPRLYRTFVRIGRASLAGRTFVWSLFVFIGQVSLCLAKSLRHPGRFRRVAIVRHIDETGLAALMIVGLLAILISMVITYQGAVQLRKFGVDVFTIDLTVIALLREMSVLVTAILVAGRSGSAFAAEIGVMKLREEVNAMITMGIDPIEALVIPRLLALVITLPILTFLADVIGLAGGGIMSLSLLDIPLDQYFKRVESVADFTMFFVGMIKAPVFAAIIAIIGCYQGLNISGSAESIGRRTTLAVVQAIFLVILADAAFSIFFSQVGV